jgi:multiple sugar transport system ATP-binding protein
MANLKLEHIYKVYPNGTKAVNDFSLDVKNGEFIVFVGPSGCGKSTTLRMIAGLEDITAGELYIDSDIVNDMEPKDRDIAMVFQNYALYPHMTVYENMAFGLRLRHVPDDIIQERVIWAAQILGITEYLDRKPRNMSGGQRQRVALGRAILRDPKVMLLDEPLSNLDAKLRAQMRTEIAKLHQKLKTTFIYVTHDQTEAMTLGDRVVVMRAGRIQQVDTPKNLYNYPGNKFVAGFIGTPQMNFFPCTLTREKETVRIHLKDNGQDLTIPYNKMIKVLPEFLDGKHDVTLGIRCEHVRIVKEPGKEAIKVRVSHYEELGAECLVYGSVVSEDDSISSQKGQIIAKTVDVSGIEPDQDIYVSFDMDNVYFFDDATENSICPRIPVYNSLSASISNGSLHVLGFSLPLPSALKGEDEIGEAELRVPVDAISLGRGPMKGKILRTEEVGDKKVVHIQCGERILFALGERAYEPGEDVAFDLDFTRLTLMKDGEAAFAPISEFDSINAQFYNFQTVMSKAGDPEYERRREEKIKAASDLMDAKIAEENDRYEKEKLALNGKDLEKEKRDARAALEKKTSENRAKIAEAKKSYSEQRKRLADDFKAAKKKAKADNNALFAERKRREIEEYKAFKAKNKDKESLRRRTDEYHIFMDNFSSERDNALALTINGLTMNYESKSSALKANTRRTIDLLKKEIDDQKAECRRAEDPYKTLEAEHKARLRKLGKEKEETVKKAGYIFFFRFPGGCYEMSTDVIANKLIQGLGTRVFTKSFRIDFPHDAYAISDKEGAFPVEVEGNLDFGSTYYAKLSYLDEGGEKRFLFLKSKEPLKAGAELRLAFDLSRSQITETDMNIRLY